MELWVALPMAVDVLPCLGVGEGELVGHGPQDGTIFEVKLVDVEGPPAAEQPPDAIDL